MKRDEALRILREHKTEIGAFGVTALSIFGSVARDEARSDSDVDLLVEFGYPVGLFQFVRLQMYLEKLLGRRVDLATIEGIRESMRQEVLREDLRAA